MSSKIREDLNYAWPTAEIAVKWPEGAVEIIFRPEIGDVEAIAAREAEYRKRLRQLLSASRGYIDVIMPPLHAAGSPALALKNLKENSSAILEKHDNIPL